MKPRFINSKIIIPIFYSLGILLIVLYQLNYQKVIRRGGDSPMFVNLMEAPAFALRGFDPNSIVPKDQTLQINTNEAFRFQSPPFRITNSDIPDLPKRTFLSPWGEPAEEFTILILVDMDSQIEYLKNNYQVKPGVYLGYIGENWEVYFNGNLVQSEMHLNDLGQIKSARAWRSVFFPLDREHIVEGLNIIALRIIGDPTSTVTGLYYTSPYYIDDFNVIEKRHHNYFTMLLCGVFGFTGIYFLVLFLTIRKKEDRFYLYFSIFSLLLCVYNLTVNRVINFIIPNSDIAVRLECATLFLLVPMLCFFIEEMGRGKTNFISKIYLVFCSLCAITQIFFCTEYGNEVLMVWNGITFLFFVFVLIYDLIYFYFWERQRKHFLKRSSDTFIYILAGTLVVFICSFLDIMDVLFINSGLKLFIFSTFVFHIGMSFSLSNRFRAINRRLEYSNTLLQQKTQTVISMQDALLTTMAEMVEYRDDITGGHIERTKRWVKILLDEIEQSGLYPEELQDIDTNLLLQSCQLHDVGKITITDNILRKPGKLTEEEHEEMKKHTIFGEHIIKKSERHANQTDFLKYAKIFAVSHHEKWDGTGYPYGLIGADIPLLGRIMAIADVYDALVSIRPYKPAFSHETAVEIINEGSGTHFDPTLVEIFNKVSDKFKD